MMSPAAFPRRVLFTVTGLTPQIVTETIYGLAVKQTPPFLPTQLVVMTTSDGANRARLTLQGNNPGWLRRLCKNYDLPPIRRVGAYPFLKGSTGDTASKPRDRARAIPIHTRADREPDPAPATYA